MPNDPTGRALQLLSLLQTHRLWRGAELAERLEVTERTVRRDIDRLRDLGYPVDATTGVDGGYRLATGAHMPPLVFDDDEAVAVAVGLRTAAGAAIGGMDESSLRALTKIEQLLPDRLRRRVSALHTSVASMQWAADDGVVDADTLSVLAVACRDGEEVRFDYRRRDGHDSQRLVEPHRLVAADRRWYLVAWDLRRNDWRTFRLDRLGDARLAGGRFAPREIPGGDAVRFLENTIGPRARHHEATIAIHAPLDQATDVLQWVDHTIEHTETESCVVRIRSEDLGRLAMTVARIALTMPVDVIEPPELAGAAARLAANLPANPTANLSGDGTTAPSHRSGR